MSLSKTEQILEAIQKKYGDAAEPEKARQQNRPPDVPRGQKTQAEELDIAMGRKRHDGR